MQTKNRSITKKLRASAVVFVAFFALATPIVFVNACGGPGDPCAPTASTPNPNASTPNPNASTPNPNASTPNPNASTPGVKIDAHIENPLGNGLTDIPTFIKTILGFVLLVSIPIITLAIIYAGFLFVTAQGNAEALGKAKKTLMYTLIGAAILLGAYVIAEAIQGTVKEIKDNNK